MPEHKLVGPFPAGENPTDYDRRRRRALWTFPGGIYLVGARSGERRNLMTCTWVTQLSFEPKLLGVAVEDGAFTHELIEVGRSFAVSVVARADREVIRRFVKPAAAGPGPQELNGVAYRDAPVTGAPILASSVAFVDCSLERTVALGSHTLFVGEIVDAGFGDIAEDEPVLRVEDTRMSYGG